MLFFGIASYMIDIKNDVKLTINHDGKQQTKNGTYT
jgi:hypothetical protein